VAPDRAQGDGELDDLALARAQKGDAGAFETLVEIFQDRVFALLWRMLGRRARHDLVEDLAQETFLGVYRALPRFSRTGPARLSTWILTIATRVALKELRARHPASQAVDAIVDVLAAPGSTDEQTHRRAFAEALERAVGALQPDHRAAFLLREYHQLDYDEIAQALEVDLGTVKSRLSRARDRLRASLKEFEP
jgi:RNA polymerase sigma-70 factor (ECF subfamily)